MAASLKEYTYSMVTTSSTYLRRGQRQCSSGKHCRYYLGSQVFLTREEEGTELARIDCAYLAPFTPLEMMIFSCHFQSIQVEH
jgi:hypothetical protein